MALLICKGIIGGQPRLPRLSGEGRCQSGLGVPPMRAADISVTSVLWLSSPWEAPQSGGCAGSLWGHIAQEWMSALLLTGYAILDGFLCHSVFWFIY